MENERKRKLTDEETDLVVGGILRTPAEFFLPQIRSGMSDTLENAAGTSSSARAAGVRSDRQADFIS